MMALAYAPPSPSPGEPTPSDELGTTMSPSPTMTQLPVTGPSSSDVTMAWASLALGLVILAVGLVAMLTMRVRRARTG